VTRLIVRAYRLIPAPARHLICARILRRTLPTSYRVLDGAPFRTAVADWWHTGATPP